MKQAYDNWQDQPDWLLATHSFAAGEVKPSYNLARRCSAACTPRSPGVETPIGSIWAVETHRVTPFLVLASQLCSWRGKNQAQSRIGAACSVCSAFSRCRSTYWIDLGDKYPSSYTFFHFRGSHRGLGRIPPILAHEDSQVSSVCYATMPIVDIIQLGLTTLVERLTPMASRTPDSPTKSVTSGASNF